MAETIAAFKDLGPSVSAILVIGLICWQLLNLFKKHGDAISALTDRIERSNNIQESLVDNISENTKMTKTLGSLIKNHVNGVKS